MSGDTVFTTRPAVEGELVQFSRVWLVRVKCPFCGEDHYHTAGKTGTQGGGLRLAGCAPGVDLPHPRAGYNIVVASGTGRRTA